MNRPDERLRHLMGPRLSFAVSAVARLISLLTLIAPASLALSQDGFEVNDSATGQLFVFGIIKGSGVPVCEAYVAHLNHSQFLRPPYCGRLQPTKGFGVGMPTRSYLASEEVNRLRPEVERFLWGRAYSTLTETSPPSLASEPLATYRFEPHIAIENDGHVHDVVIWDDEVRELRQCGLPVGNNYVGQGFDQIPVIVGADGHLDVHRTLEIFGRRRSAASETGGELLLGRSGGVFEYHGSYYFDTFFDNNSRSGNSDSRRVESKPSEPDVLGVFLRRGRVRREICEIKLFK